MSNLKFDFDIGYFVHYSAFNGLKRFKATCGYPARIEMKLAFPHDVHTHTTYSDGRGSMWENLENAVAAGLEVLGISDHIHYLPPRAFNTYVREIKMASNDVPLVLLVGVETNIVENGPDIADWQAEKLDYIIASVHTWVKTPEEYLELVKLALLDENVDVIGHFGASFPYVGFPPQACIDEVLNIAEANGKAFEISSRYKVPDPGFVGECIRRGIKLTFASDAHSPGEVGRIGWAERVFQKAGGRKEDLLFGELL